MELTITVFPLNEKHNKVLALTSEEIIISDKKHKTAESVLKSLEKKGMLENLSRIPLSQVIRLDYREEEYALEIFFRNAEGKEKSKSVVMANTEDRAYVIQQLKDSRNFVTTQRAEKKWLPLAINAFWMAFVGGMIWLGLTTNAALARGEEISYSGRNRGIKKLMTMAFEFLGVEGVWAVGIGVIAYLIWSACQRFQNPQTIYSIHE
ncbi:hypothetical protein [Persicobacter diffluens]|uniref:Uncharacterized protein n=1 Tax=Persicobacter diffluens TaxID=981 RepID=A0AAN4VXG6_9BACT|nr:hypothetical protein PEDI_15910 [Persicobacter diffluens]